MLTTGRSRKILSDVAVEAPRAPRGSTSMPTQATVVGKGTQAFCAGTTALDDYPADE